MLSKAPGRPQRPGALDYGFLKRRRKDGMIKNNMETNMKGDAYV